MYLEIFLADFTFFGKFRGISRDFAGFRGISRKYLNFAGPRPREISEALPLGSKQVSTEGILNSYLHIINLLQ